MADYNIVEELRRFNSEMRDLKPLQSAIHSEATWSTGSSSLICLHWHSQHAAISSAALVLDEESLQEFVDVSCDWALVHGLVSALPASK